MKKHLLITAAALMAAGSLYLAADDRHERFDAARAVPLQKYADAKTSQKLPQPPASEEAFLYQNECGACHMAYQPGLLPAASWSRVMATLEDHFGTDATLEKPDAVTIAAYLDTHAGDVMPASKHMRRIETSISADAPMQISKSGYFVKEHRKIPPRVIAQNEVKSLANCTACHTKAESGSFREREILIPNYGRWDD